MNKIIIFDDGIQVFPILCWYALESTTTGAKIDETTYIPKPTGRGISKLIIACRLFDVFQYGDGSRHR